MALTDDQKSAVRAYLGFSDGFSDVDTRLESQLGNLKPTAETRVIALSAQILAVDTKLQANALSRTGVKEIVGEVVLSEEGLAQLRTQGRMLCTRLGQVFNLAPKADYFDTGGGSMGGMFSLG